ncbi:hypothetical protein [Thauera humireducens]|uniref:Uncharacterized protein n=1 Tax=Thauera humireducens TaxID=1134435 RepID=A0A127K367_9RHOO|nr:hypothetical protein [Thauera humireducens]AMO36397.1 hypothetical protein AC731_005280 [Thauera humireducens]
MSNLYDFAGAPLIRRTVKGLKLDAAALPADVKDRLVWAAIEVAIAYGSCDIEASHEYAGEALERLSDAMKGAECYGVPCETEDFFPMRDGDPDA